ncbi:cell differentiation protein rcd1 isoform X2 [Ricinus communis]|uniref:cell differentiation protein rcd1 isoform X2 n=1 Tax=Ricinus communis TaxID=3988 RepID=UPI00201B01C2|nr:cell differentiation protein rcd1 isoform X2 [Ricinus communis]
MSNDPQSQFERYTDSEFRALLFNLIPALHNHGTRDHVLHILSKAYKETRNKVIHEEMAPLLWHSIGKISILLQVLKFFFFSLSTLLYITSRHFFNFVPYHSLFQELLSVYPALNEHLTERLSTRVSNALALLQSVAAHTDTRMHFIKANIACYLQPILNIKNNDKYHEHVRISSLQVIGALVKDDDPRGVLFILQSQMLPSFLNCMEVGSITAKTVAVFIIKKILSNEEGMKYCCVLAERFFAIGNILGKIIEELVEAGRLLEDNSKQLLEQIIGCYYKLSANPRACDGLRCCLPSKLKDTSFTSFFHGDQQMMLCLQQIFYNIEVAEWGRSHLYRKLGRHLVRY